MEAHRADVVRVPLQGLHARLGLVVPHLDQLVVRTGDEVGAVTTWGGGKKGGEGQASKGAVTTMEAGKGGVRQGGCAARGVWGRGKGGVTTMEAGKGCVWQGVCGRGGGGRQRGQQHG